MPKCKNPACDYPASRDAESMDFCCEKCEGRHNGEDWASKGRKRHTAYCSSNREGFNGDDDGGGSALFLDRNGNGDRRRSAGDSSDEDGRRPGGASKKRRGRRQGGGGGADLFDHPPLLGSDPAAYGASWPGGPLPLPPPPLDGGNLQVFGTDGGMPMPGAMPGAMPFGNSGMPSMAPDETGGLGGAAEGTDEADPIARMERAIMRSLSASETISEVQLGNPAPLPQMREGKADSLRSMMREEPVDRVDRKGDGKGDSTNNRSQRSGGPRLWRPPPPRLNPQPALPGIPPGAVPQSAGSGGREGSSGSMQMPEPTAPLPAAPGPCLPPEPAAQAPAAPGKPRAWRPPIPGGGAIGVPRPWRPPMPGGRSPAASSEPVLSGIPPALRNMKALAAAAAPVSSRSVDRPAQEVAVKTDKLANSLRDKLMANRKRAAPETKQEDEAGAGGAGDYQQRIAGLEALKKQAIDIEDFDEAKRLKLEIKKLQEEAELATVEAAEQAKAAEENARSEQQKKQTMDNEKRSRRSPSPPARGPSPPARGPSPPARGQSPPRPPSPAANRGPSPEAVRRTKEASEQAKAALAAEKEFSPLEIMANNARKAQDSQRVMQDERLRKQLEKRDEKEETAVNKEVEEDEDDMF